MKKLIIVVPHLSTGGLPQYTVKQIESMVGEYEVWCVEWDNITGGVLVVQRNKIQEILSDRLVTLAGEKYEFLSLIDSVEPDIIHFQEVPETFVPLDILNAVWFDDRTYDIVVTTHSSYTNPAKIRYIPDRYVLVSNWSHRRFAAEFGNEMCSVWEYPVETITYDKGAAKNRLGFDDQYGKIHVLHVGLFTPGKNQSFIVEVAKFMKNYNPNVEFHFVGNQADNFSDYWRPIMENLPENCTWHGERSDVDEFYKAADVFVFPSLFELNPLSLKEARSFGLPLAIRNLETYENEYDGLAIYFEDDVEQAAKAILTAHSELGVSNLYYGVQRNSEIRKIDPSFTVNFVDGPYAHIHDAPGDTFHVTFTDRSTGIVHYSSIVGNDCWAKATLKFAADWHIRFVRQSDGRVFEEEFNPTGKRVLISLDSKSLGDTMAWFPQVDNFRKKWNCEVVCSTFMNEQFVDSYPEMQFVPPGTVVHGIYAMFNIGWYFEGDSHHPQYHPREFNKLPLSQTAADILGLDYVQTRAKLKPVDFAKRKRVGIGVHSTAQPKYWNNPTGWQEVTNFLTSVGYEVIVLSNEGDGYMGNSYPTGASVLPPGDFETLKSEILSCQMFIGLGSGLSWLAWTLGIRTVLISGFSTPQSEFEGDDVIRIFNGDVCNGCYNRHRFNPGDWNWCPDHQGTERQFECTKSIRANDVISKIVEKGWVSFL